MATPAPPSAASSRRRPSGPRNSTAARRIWRRGPTPPSGCSWGSSPRWPCRCRTCGESCRVGRDRGRHARSLPGVHRAARVVPPHRGPQPPHQRPARLAARGRTDPHAAGVPLVSHQAPHQHQRRGDRPRRRGRSPAPVAAPRLAGLAAVDLPGSLRPTRLGQAPSRSVGTGGGRHRHHLDRHRRDRDRARRRAARRGHRSPGRRVDAADARIRPDPHWPYDSTERFHDTGDLPSRVLNIALLGQNYHLVHHLWNSLPGSRYQDVHRATRNQLAAVGARFDWGD